MIYISIYNILEFQVYDRIPPHCFRTKTRFGSVLSLCFSLDFSMLAHYSFVLPLSHSLRSFRPSISCKFSEIGGAAESEC